MTNIIPELFESILRSRFRIDESAFFVKNGDGIGISGINSGAIGRGFEEGERELLVDNADIEVNKTGAGDVDADAFDGEPEEELLSRNTGQISDLAET